jgi:hypothetical protein
MVNPFRSELLGHKAIFALLTDTGQDFGFDAAEREAIRGHVPWARQVVDGRTTDPEGAGVDLVEYLRDRREHLVLKPAHDFGVQQRIELHREDYPAMEPGMPARRFYEDTDPFMYRGEFGGLLTRLGTSEITNVHADGSVCAAVAVAPRDRAPLPD